MPTSKDPLLAIADLIVRNRPDLLGHMLKLAFRTPGVFERLGRTFDAADFHELQAAIRRTSRHLDLLEKHPGRWRRPDEALGEDTQLPALLLLCRARQRSVSSITRQRRLERIERKLQRALEASKKTWVREFLESPPG